MQGCRTEEYEATKGGVYTVTLAVVKAMLEDW